MKIAIVGWGIEGQSAFKYFGPEHEYLIVSEEPRNDFPKESERVKIKFLSDERKPGITSNVSDLSYLDGLESCDKIICTPTSIKALERKFPKDNNVWKKITTVLEIFFQNVNTPNIIGVTGTKGKGTTSTLIARMLEASGKKVHLGGNIGLGVLDFINDVKPDDWVVLELSNFQLYSLKHSPHIAVCLMIMSEHLDWHPSMDEYVGAKANIFKWQKPDDIAIYLAGNAECERIASQSAGAKMPYFKSPGAFVREDGKIVIDGAEIIDKSEVKLLGEHNLQNVCAAVTAVWQVTQTVGAIAEVLRDFSGLEHRLELVRELNGVRYYDDSFGTTPDTAIVAIKSFRQPEIVILGGSDKGADYSALADQVIKSRVKHAIIIGQTGEKISHLLRDRGFNNITYGLTTMPEIVATAHKLAESGDVVLLSTASASFGLFKDYKDRGNQFRAAASKLSSVE